MLSFLLLLTGMWQINDCVMGKQCSRYLGSSLTFWIISVESQGIRISPGFQDQWRGLPWLWTNQMSWERDVVKSWVALGASGLLRGSVIMWLFSLSAETLFLSQAAYHCYFSPNSSHIAYGFPSPPFSSSHIWV